MINPTVNPFHSVPPPIEIQPTKLVRSGNKKSKFEFRTGDSFDLINALEKESVDLIITSPPYWGLRSYGLIHNWNILDDWKRENGVKKLSEIPIPSYEWYKKNGGVLGLEPIPEWYIEHLVEFFDLARSKLKKSGNIWINIGDTFFARWSSIRDEGRQGLGSDKRFRRKTPMGGHLQEKQLLLIPSRFAIKMQERKWILRNDLIWFKPNVPPRPEKDRLKLSHEHFFHFVHKPSYGRAKYFYDITSAEKGELDVVRCLARPGENGHTATFPEDLILPRIQSSCPKGGLVLDPFCGTGRAVRSAFNLGRDSIGFDLSKKFRKEWD